MVDLYLFSYHLSMYMRLYLMWQRTTGITCSTGSSHTYLSTHMYFPYHPQTDLCRNVPKIVCSTRLKTVNVFAVSVSQSLFLSV